jgi:transposase
MKRAQKIGLDVNNKQAAFFSKSCGCVRLAYNRGLAYRNEPYKVAKADAPFGKPNHYSVKKDRYHLKNEQYPFVNE